MMGLLALFYVAREGVELWRGAHRQRGDASLRRAPGGAGGPVSPLFW